MSYAIEVTLVHKVDILTPEGGDTDVAQGVSPVVSPPITPKPRRGDTKRTR